MRWCARCVLPDTRPGIVIGDDGVCNACRTHGLRPEVDWAERARAFGRLCESVRSDGPGYDALIPVSGGKDSHWQVLTCLEHGLKPLCVTWRPPGRTALGQANLDNLVRLGVDHIDFTVNPDVESRFMLAAFRRFGTPGLPMHMAIFGIPLAMALRMSIPLVVWGENSALEYGSPDGLHMGERLTSGWLARHGVMHGTTAEDWIGSEGLSARDLTPYFGPSPDDLEAKGLRAVFLGWYFPWDPEAVRRVASGSGFSASADGARTGFYDYADVDDEFIAVHHWLKWYKFGFTRTFDNLSLEIRNGRMTRGEALAEIARRGDEMPREDIEAASAFMRISPEEFFRIAERFRNPDVWTRHDGRWTIPDFIVPDWEWT
ncbi:N-acetyl sugar amidotransferase [Desulfobaculum xiamenense]|uniref:N-acetyl sugar amidotransferase n=1 Tax=Desulfobaculum xiamenense TaxID=995050 RepID=A0A846QR09_9BACT|nr:N-acetyl sugar amidotransferase [Desulfobaculum xiamenense]NJB67089.1 N-acetyl sugar amidotransferase [Desulfobaculum xiamenense]